MNILEQKSIKKFIQITMDAFSKGWNERNGGNLTHRLDKEEVEEIKEFLNLDSPWEKLDVVVKNIANQFFVVTGSGCFFRNVSLIPEENMGIIQVDETGTAFRRVWGLKGVRPTSELPTHLMNHDIKFVKKEGKHHTILHAHCTNLIALTFVLEPKEEAISHQLWEMATECPIVFPDGIGLVEWMVPGGKEIAIATSEKMKKYDAVIWAHHGLFCSGENLDIAFGLMDTIEKSAEILVKVISMGGKRQTILNEDFKVLGEAFNVKLNSEILEF